MNILDELSEQFLSSLSPQQAELLLRDLDAAERSTSIEALRSFIQEQGWQQVQQHLNTNQCLFQKTPDGGKQPHVLMLPLSRETLNAEEQIALAVNLLAKVGRTSPFHILQLARQQPTQKIPSDVRTSIVRLLAQHQKVLLKIHLVEWDEDLSRQLQEAGCEPDPYVQIGRWLLLAATMSNFEQLQRLIAHPCVAYIERMPLYGVSQNEVSTQREERGDLRSRQGDQFYQDTFSHLHRIEERFLREQLHQKMRYRDALYHLRMIENAVEGIRLEREAAQVDHQFFAHTIERYQREMQIHKDWLTFHGFLIDVPDENIIVQNEEKLGYDLE